MRIETKGIVLLIALLPLHASAEPVVVRTSLEAQIRAVANLVDDDDRDTGGVQVRRALLDFQAERETGRASGRIRLSADRGTGAVSLDYCYLDMTPTPRWLIRMGQFKPRFLREEIIAYTRQIASERSYVSDYFTVDLTQGIEASRRGARWLISAALHDGAYAAATDFNADGRDLAAAARFDWLLAGDWAVLKGFRPVRGASPAMLLGLAADHEGGPGRTADRAAADFSLAAGRTNLLLSAVWQHLDAAAALPEADQLGLVMQAACLIGDDWDVFARWERLRLDGLYQRAGGGGLQSGSGAVTQDELTVWTAGVNRYLDGQSSRWTLDLVHAADAVPVKNTGAGLLAVNAAQTAIRLQYQMIF